MPASSEIFGQLPALVTMPEAAEALRVTTRTVQKLLARGELRAAKLAGGSSKLLIPRAELERLVAASLR